MKPRTSLLPAAMAFIASLAIPVLHSAEPIQGNFRMHHGFKVFYLPTPDGELTILCPPEPAPGLPWVLGQDNHAYLDIFGEHPPVTANMGRTQLELAKRGFHVVALKLGNTFGAPEAIAKWDAVYKLMTEKYGFSPKLSMMGLSRGGLSIARWAAQNPGKVNCLYMDKAVSDIKSWPGGKLGGGSGSPADWEALKQVYGFKGDEEAMAWKENPNDLAAKLAAGKVAIVQVAGAKDTTVPYAENGGVMEKIYKQKGGDFKLVWRAEEGHHPHGLPDPAPVVDFIAEHSRISPAKTN